MTINDRFKFITHCKGVEGRKADREPLSLLFWLIACWFVAMAALCWYLVLPKPAQGSPFINQLPLSADKSHKYVEAYITKYNNRGITASGEITELGFVACPRDIAIGRSVFIGGIPYICKDRYATWVDKSRDLPTFDIWTTESDQEALAFGIHKEQVEIIE
jgi:hypothetical protein